MLRASSTALALVLFTLSGSVAAEPLPRREVHRPQLVLGSVKDNGGVREVGPDGAEWAFPGGGRVIAAPGASLVILKGSQPLNLGHGTVRAYSVALRSGTVRVRVPDGGTSALIVAAPRKVIAVVAGGETVVGAGSQVAVANAGGQTSVSVGSGRHRPVDPGTLVVVGPTGESRRAVAPPPQATGGKGVLVSFAGALASSDFAWSAVPEAGSYLAEIRRADSNHLVSRSVVQEPRMAVGLEPGAYTLRVAAVDPSGVECSLPHERPVHVVSVTLPDGAYHEASGAVRFPRGTKLGLSHTEGVEMAYGSALHYVAAPAELELLRAEPRLVRLRAGSHGDDATLLLLPRSTRAEVEFGARTPRWPGESLPIRIRLQAAGGAEVPASIEARPRVTVGVEPVEVTFTREGGWLTGALPPQPGPGPWVVRVEVADQHGFELGRDFIEVSQAGPTPSPRTPRSKRPSAKVASGNGS